MPRRPAAVIAARPPTPMARTIAMLLAALPMTAVTLAATAPVRAVGGDGLRRRRTAIARGMAWIR